MNRAAFNSLGVKLPVSHRLIKYIGNDFIGGRAYRGGVAVDGGDVAVGLVIVKVLEYLLEALLVVLGIGKPDFDLNGKPIGTRLLYAVDLLHRGGRKVISHDITLELQVAIARHLPEVGVALKIVLQVLGEALGKKGWPGRRVVLNGGNRNGPYRGVDVGSVEGIHTATA